MGRFIAHLNISRAIDFTNALTQIKVKTKVFCWTGKRLLSEKKDYSNCNQTTQSMPNNLYLTTNVYQAPACS